MKNITLAVVIMLGFSATEAFAQTRTRQNLLGDRCVGSLRERRALREQQRAEEGQVTENNAIHQVSAEEIWSIWPREVSWWDTNIVKKCEEKFNVVFCGGDNGGWKRGCGKCLIEWERGLRMRIGWGAPWKKYNSDGVLIQVEEGKNFEEYVWMTNSAVRVTIENRKKWAKEHGVSYDDVKKKYEAHLEQMSTKTKNLASAAAEAQLAAERAEREKERAKMVEERKRQREATEKSKEEK